MQPCHFLPYPPLFRSVSPLLYQLTQCFRYFVLHWVFQQHLVCLLVMLYLVWYELAVYKIGWCVLWLFLQVVTVTFALLDMFYQQWLFLYFQHVDQFVEELEKVHLVCVLLPGLIEKLFDLWSWKWSILFFIVYHPCQLTYKLGESWLSYQLLPATWLWPCPIQLWRLNICAF